jgi:hypothetical protein
MTATTSVDLRVIHDCQNLLGSVQELAEQDNSETTDAFVIDAAKLLRRIVSHITYGDCSCTPNFVCHTCRLITQFDLQETNQ